VKGGGVKVFIAGRDITRAKVKRQLIRSSEKNKERVGVREAERRKAEGIKCVDSLFRFEWGRGGDENSVGGGLSLEEIT